MKQLVILGAGETGVGAALLANSKGYKVFVSDSNPIATPYRQELIQEGIAFEEGQHTWDKIKNATEIIKSPGIQNDAPIIQAIQQANISILSEIEFASRYTDAILIGITGSNGKSTTTYLAYHLLKTAGLDVGIAGNMGESFAKKVLLKKYAYYVLELSSFQLDDVHKFKLDIACILNITADHLNRYQYQLSSYIAAKFKILKNMTRKGHFIYNQDDVNIDQYLKHIEAGPILQPISLLYKNAQGAYVDYPNLCFVRDNQIFQIPIQSLPFLGKHNWYNAMAAISIASLLHVSTASILAGLESFKGLPHRIEWVAEINEIGFYNDSKATNVESAAVALESFTQPIIWIAGGYDKGNNYELLKSIVKNHVKVVICLGKTNEAILKAFQLLNLPTYETQVMQEAVEIALSVAMPGEIILLSPACASFDLFKNFEDRGQQFKNAVHKILTKL